MVNANYRIALDYRCHRLSDRSQYYDIQVAGQVSKMTRRLSVLSKSQIIDGSDPISILRFILAFKMVCDSIGIQEWSTMWFFHLFLDEEACRRRPHHVHLSVQLKPDKSRRYLVS